MNYREKMKEYLKEPDEYSSQYGKWGILNKEQRDLIKRLLKEMDNADLLIKELFLKNENKNKIVNDLLKRISNLEFEVEDLEKYKARCEKAIEFINGGKDWKKYKYTYQEQKLLEILQGSDKE